MIIKLLIYTGVAIVLINIIIRLIKFWKWRKDIIKKLSWVGCAPGLPILGNALDFKDSTTCLTAMHNYVTKENGICYIELLTRPLILISDYQLLEWLLSSTTILKKSMDYQYLAAWLEEGILITDGENWKTSRKIVTPAFHFAILEQFVEVFDRPISTLIQLLEHEVENDSVNIHPYITNFSLDVICETSMGVEMDIQTNPKSEYVKSVKAMCKIVVERAFNPLKMIPLFYNLSYDAYLERKYVKHLHSVSNSLIQKRKAEIENGSDSTEKNQEEQKKKMAFLDLLLKYRDEEGHFLPHNYIRQEVDTFMFAGHDTTAAAISFALYCLANNPDEQEIALKEVQEVYAGKEKVSYTNLQQLKYLELCIKETLRLYPSVPFYSRQTTEDVNFNDKIIPKGVTLIVIAYTVNRNPKVFPEPDKFIPSRFQNIENKPYSYLPFSAGPRNCIGQKFAMLEMKSTLAKILLNFELLPSAISEHKPILAAETVLKSKNGINIKLRKRYYKKR